MTTGNEWHAELIRPRQAEHDAPCHANCPSGIAIRDWIATIAQRAKLGLDKEQAFTRAWQTLVEHNPLPAVLGRVCPHACETHCNRGDKESPVSIHAMERFLGDWAIARGLPLPVADAAPAVHWPESLGVIGAGPAGLSFAYQMARRSYRVTIYDQHDAAGGMLRYGIPEYRLPRAVLDHEIRRIVDLGVDIRCGVRVGVDLPVEELTSRHAALFVGIGADKPMVLDIPGERGPGVLCGTHFMFRATQGHSIRLGGKVVVIGGGNTAIDAARAALRLGAEVTILYRRTLADMPAIADEIDAALAEGVDIRALSQPIAVLRRNGHVVGVEVQPMQTGEPDASGRCAPEPSGAESWVLAVDTVIEAVSQRPEWDHLQQLNPGGGKLTVDRLGNFGDKLWAGGDVLGLGTVTRSVGHGRRAAEALHARLRGLAAEPAASPPLTSRDMHLDHYTAQSPVAEPHRPVASRLAAPREEVCLDISEQEFLDEASRCLSCGNCFGCEFCWMYCNAGAYTRESQVAPGHYFAFDPSVCEGCGKCVELCPCGFLSAES